MSIAKQSGRVTVRSRYKVVDGKTGADAAPGGQIGRAGVVVRLVTRTSRNGDTITLNAQQAAVKRGVAVMRELGNRVNPAELEAVIAVVERAFQPVESSGTSSGASTGAVTGEERLMELLTGGRTYSAAERAALELAQLEHNFEQRRRLLGSALSVDQAWKVLGCKTRQTVHDRRKAGTLLGVMEGGTWKFPIWQFDANSPAGIVAGLPAVLKALGEYAPVSPLQKASFLLQPSPWFAGRSALEALKSGRVDDVVALARGVGVN